MGRVCTLGVRQWAAIRVDAGEEAFGSAGAEDVIPAAVRRRMGKLERLAVRCMLGLLANNTTSEVIFCSRYGNIGTLSTMLTCIAAGELISPMAFSGSVHNAAPGLVAQIRKERIPHTALAAGPHTFEAGLIEAYTRLMVEDCSDVVVCFADLPLPDPYQTFEVEGRPGLALALRLGLDLAEKAAEKEDVVRPGRVGAFDVLAGLQRGDKSVVVGGGEWLVPQ